MKYVPHLFNTDMVRALLAGTKTQTRRLPNPNNCVCDTAKIKDLDFSRAVACGTGTGYEYMKAPRLIDDGTWHRVFYKAEPGDVIWVREACCRVSLEHAHDLLEGRRENDLYVRQGQVHEDWMEYAKEKYGYSWTPSIHMPKEACRLWLPVQLVRVQRLQDISSDDAVAEGVASRLPENNIARRQYLDLWASINGYESVTANPLLFAVTFEVSTVRPADFLTR